MIVKMWPLNYSTSTNSYVTSILSKNITYKSHSWREAFNLNFDAFHMHWPETYWNQKSYLSRLLGTLMVISYLCLLRLLRKKIIWTVHNLTPHENENPKLSRLSYRCFYFLSNSLIFLSNSSKIDFFNLYQFDPQHKLMKIIPHPLYPIPFVKDDDKIHKGLLFFGLMRQYKNVEALINEYNKIKTDVVLNLIGNCTDLYKRKLLSISSSNINLELGAYQEDRLQQYLNSSLGVVIPYTKITNSGVIFRAVSSNVKLLLPDIAYTREVVDTLSYHKNCQFYKGDINSQALKLFCEFTKRKISHSCEVNHDNYNHIIQESHSDLYQLTLSGFS